MHIKYEGSGSTGCIMFLILIVVNISVGAWSVSYLLDKLLGKDIPLIADILIGLIVAEITIPVAIVVKILEICNVL